MADPSEISQEEWNMAKLTERTSFTKDVEGRYLCNLEPADPTDLTAHLSRVELDPRTDEYGTRHARVTLTPGPRDNELWNVMDATMQQVANLLGNGTLAQIICDGLGTTHHETGTLWMGSDPAHSVTNEDGRFHYTENLYAAGPSLFPSTGAPNLMLTGVAWLGATAIV
jgi:choline dehydrogenase-like flavoprotein